jgi:hypothetical protein
MLGPFLVDVESVGIRSPHSHNPEITMRIRKECV